MTEMTPDEETQDHLLDRMLESSWVVGLLRNTFRDDSRFAVWTNYLSIASRNSFLYRWLTKEPDSEVVFIDLRETYTIGPFIKLLDRIIENIYPYWQTSTLRHGVNQVVSFGEYVLETRPGQLLTALFVPPESRERVSSRNTSNNPTASTPSVDEKDD